MISYLQTIEEKKILRYSDSSCSVAQTESAYKNMVYSVEISKGKAFIIVIISLASYAM